jgi:hypothetical protein
MEAIQLCVVFARLENISLLSHIIWLIDRSIDSGKNEPALSRLNILFFKWGIFV